MHQPPHLVQDILANLQFLRKSTVRSSQFEHVLTQTWTQLLHLLAPPEHSQTLEISCSAFSPLKLNVFTENLPSKLGETDVTYTQVLHFVENGPNHVSGSDYGARILQTNQVLQEKHEIERVPGLLRRDHAQVLALFLELVSLIADSLNRAENEVMDYCCRCFLYEAASTKNNGLQLVDGDIDTEKLVSAIDNYTGSISGNGHTFPIPGNGLSPTQPLNFQCSDPHFKKLYSLFLQLALHKRAPESYEEIWPYANVMLMLYKQITATEAFSPADETPMDARIMDFLCGSESVVGIISPPLREYALEVLLMDTEGENREEIPQQAAWDTEESLSPQSPVSQAFTKPELLALVADFETVVSTLIEYDRQIDSSLPKTFRNYICLTYQEFPESATEDDFRFIDTVVSTIAAVVDYVALDEYSEHDTIGAILLGIGDIQTCLSEISVSSTLLMRLAISDMANAISFATTCVRRWNRKLLVARQLRVIYEEEYVPRAQRKLLRHAFSKWRNKDTTFRQLQAEASLYCKKKQLSHHFNNRWIKAMLRTIEMHQTMERFQMAKSVNVWKTKLEQSRELSLQSDSHHNSKILAKGLRVWISQCEKVADIDLSATKLGHQIRAGSDNLLKLKVWQCWKQELNRQLPNNSSEVTSSLSEKLSILNQQYRSFLLRKYLNVLISRSANQKAMVLFENIRNSFIKQRFFGVLRTKKQLSNIRDVVIQERNLTLKKSAFECWYDQLRSKTLADSKSRQSLLEKYWKLWQLKENEARFKEVQATKLTQTYFKKWLLRHKSLSLIHKTNVETTHTAFSKWKRRILKVFNDEEIADVSHIRSATGESLEIWRSRMATNHEMVIVADLNFQRKFFNKIWASHLKTKDNFIKADQFLGNSLSLADRLDMKASLKKWQDVYLTRYEREASDALIYFQTEVRNAGISAVFFKHWRKKHQKLKKHQAVLEKNLQFFNNTNILKSECLMHWIDVSRAKHNALEESAEFYRTLLHKRYLLVWYEKYVTKSRYLSEVADELVNKREYNQMVDLLRKWNLTFTKNVRRNQQTCEMFVEKWERNNLKSLFELWVFKAQKKMAMEDDYAEANTTFGSNTSPLSRKFIGSGASLEYLDGESYLNTPVKKQVTRLPFTPAKTSTSPTRLQETNQKMKSTKMDALTNRYKLAKGEPKDYKSKLFRSDSTVLPPPSITNSPSARLPIRPPPAPRFETYSVTQNPRPEATSSPEISVLSGQESEDRVIETAKRLQRIKPVVIPQNSPSSEIRLSPISKLRERLQSRTGALKSPSDVF